MKNSPTNTTKSAKSATARNSGNGNRHHKSNSNNSKRDKLFAELKERLMQERQILIDEAMKNQTLANVQGYVAHGDIADLGNDLVNNEMMRGFAEHERQRIREIDDALARMDKGTYGVCEISARKSATRA